jgi:FMN phosphatase YigB (HAD superfamily)
MEYRPPVSRETLIDYPRPMVRAIWFDMGGTLDGDGLHWLERFLTLYRSCGIELPRELIRHAFDEAERRSAYDNEIASADFAEMIRLHVKWQLEGLRLTNPDLDRNLVEGFIKSVRQTTYRNVQLLANLNKQGFQLGIISNGCGNVDKLCQDFGYTPFLSIIIDSRRVGLFKPDPAIFRFAAEKMGGDPGTMLMVGDSFERDVLPAKEAGMKTAWLEGEAPRNCPDPGAVNYRLRRLTDLPQAILAESVTR